MLRANLMRGGIVLWVVAVLWTPAVWAVSPIQPLSEDGPEITSGPVEDPGWMGWLLGALRSLVGADEGEYRGDIDPVGQPGTSECTSECGASGSGESTTTTTTTTSEP